MKNKWSDRMFRKIEEAKKRWQEQKKQEIKKKLLKKHRAAIDPVRNTVLGLAI